MIQTKNNYLQILSLQGNLSIIFWKKPNNFAIQPLYGTTGDFKSECDCSTDLCVIVIVYNQEMSPNT